MRHVKTAIGDHIEQKNPFALKLYERKRFWLSSAKWPEKTGHGSAARKTMPSQVLKLSNSLIDGCKKEHMVTNLQVKDRRFVSIL